MSAPDGRAADHIRPPSAVEHRGIEYEIKRGIGANAWVWIVHTPTPKQGKIVFGLPMICITVALAPSPPTRCAT
jgi:hypothetical protein